MHADPDRLSQAIFGLSLNALQAISEAAGKSDLPAERRILLRASQVENLIRLEVRDSGPGVPAALEDQIFEPFVTSKDSGTGLGLPMALRMVEAQGGALRLASHDEPAKGDPPGACFILEFPSVVRDAA